MQTSKTKSRMFMAVLIVFFIMLTFYLYFASGFYTAGKVKRYLAPRYEIYGYSFKGVPQDKRYVEIFDKMVKLMESNKIEGTVAGLYINEMASKEDSVDLFVGIIPRSKSADVSGLEKKVVEEREVLQVDINDLPGYLPNIVYPGIEKYASDNDIKISKKNVLELGKTLQPEVIQVPILKE